MPDKDQAPAQDTSKKDQFILASASPRRKELLARIQIIPDQIIPADIDETPGSKETPKDLALRLSIEKAKAISAEYNDHYILAADTVVGLGRRVLDKALNEDDARSYLAQMSGRRHSVFGGIAIYAPKSKGRNQEKLVSRVLETSVQFKRLTSQEIDEYIASGEWDGKAGGYAIQGMAESYIKYIRGSYSNVVGLSLYDTMQMLNGVGFQKHL